MLFDEVWEGVLHINPAPSGRHGKVDRQLAVLLDPLVDRAGLASTGPFNLGDERDYRVPDAGVHRSWSDRVWYASAALVIEIVSPSDETFAKLDFYAAHGVDEVLIVDPEKRSVELLALDSGRYGPVDRSRVIELRPAELKRQIDWP